jgi:hypothetical protein
MVKQNMSDNKLLEIDLLDDVRFKYIILLEYIVIYILLFIDDVFLKIEIATN